MEERETQKGKVHKKRKPEIGVIHLQVKEHLRLAKVRQDSPLESS